MNLADAIRQAAQQTGAQLPSAEPKPEVVDATSAFAKAAKAPTPAAAPAPATPAQGFQTDAMTQVELTSVEDARVPLPPSIPVGNGSVVRLELFLSPDQMASLFKAVVATQHSVMTLREAAAYLRIPAHTLEQMAQEGEVPAFMIDGRWRLPRHGVDEWLFAQAQENNARREMEA